jgi:hypothetical protein
MGQDPGGVQGAQYTAAGALEMGRDHLRVKGRGPAMDARRPLRTACQWMAPIEERNPEIRAVLLAVQRQLNLAVKSGGRGTITFKELPYLDGHFGKWQMPAIGEFLDLSRLKE